MSWSRALASVALGSVTVACSILVSTSGLSGGPDPAAVGDAEASVDGGGDGPSSDGPTETGIPSCDPNKPFVVTAFPPPIKTSSYEFAGSLSPDRLTLYFASDRGGQSEIYVTKRGSIGGDDWSSPEKLSELGQGSNIAIAADQLSIAFDTQRNGSKDLYRAHRASVTAPFDAPAPFSGVNSGVKEDLEPWPSADGKHLYFASDRGGNLALYVASQVSGDTFVGPTPICVSSTRPTTTKIPRSRATSSRCSSRATAPAARAETTSGSPTARAPPRRGKRPRSSPSSTRATTTTRRGSAPTGAR